MSAREAEREGTERTLVEAELGEDLGEDFLRERLQRSRAGLAGGAENLFSCLKGMDLLHRVEVEGRRKRVVAPKLVDQDASRVVLTSSWRRK